MLTFFCCCCCCSILTSIGFLIDRVGRRPLLLSMISLMAAVMICQTGLIWNVEQETSIAKACGTAAAAMLFVFQGAFTIGFQATVWVYPSEILPLKLRQRGSSVSTACNWICVGSSSSLLITIHHTDLIELHHRLYYPTCHSQYQVQNIYHFWGRPSP